METYGQLSIDKIGPELRCLITTRKRSITLHYFALLREQRGLGDERISTVSSTPRGIYGELQARYSFTLPVDRISVAVNDQFRPMDHPLEDGDHLVFIPPVAGG